MLVLRYFSMHTFKVTLSSCYTRTLTASIGCVTTAFTGGAPEVLSLEILPVKCKVCSQGLVGTHDEQLNWVALRELPDVLVRCLCRASRCASDNI